MGFSREMSIDVELLGMQINSVLQNITECQTEGFLMADLPFQKHLVDSF